MLQGRIIKRVKAVKGTIKTQAIIGVISATIIVGGIATGALLQSNNVEETKSLEAIKVHKGEQEANKVFESVKSYAKLNGKSEKEATAIAEKAKKEFLEKK